MVNTEESTLSLFYWRPADFCYHQTHATIPGVIQWQSLASSTRTRSDERGEVNMLITYSVGTSTALQGQEGRKEGRKGFF